MVLLRFGFKMRSGALFFQWSVVARAGFLRLKGGRRIKEKMRKETCFSNVRDLEIGIYYD